MPITATPTQIAGIAANHNQVRGCAGAFWGAGGRTSAAGRAGDAGRPSFSMRFRNVRSVAGDDFALNRCYNRQPTNILIKAELFGVRQLAAAFCCMLGIQSGSKLPHSK